MSDTEDNSGLTSDHEEQRAIPPRPLPGWATFRSQVFRPGDIDSAGLAAPSDNPDPRIESETIVPPPGTRTETPGQSPIFELPCELGRYRLMRLLGEGGMGTVYLAHDLQLRRDVALKMPKVATDPSREWLNRFSREARMAATLRHPNLCPIYDVGEHQGTPYLTMAYIEGRPLSELISSPDQPLEQDEVVRLVRTVALALQAAHAKGVIHRDLKPGNILIDGDREPIVMDFGLARSYLHSDERLTEIGGMVGTPEYMSPEQTLGEPDTIGPATDIYSLGVILYECLTGRPPFAGGPPAAVIGQVLTKAPPPMSAYRPGINTRLEEICQKALAKKPEERFVSMREFADELNRSLSELLESSHAENWLGKLNISEQSSSDDERRLERPGLNRGRVTAGRVNHKLKMISFSIVKSYMDLVTGIRKSIDSSPSKVARNAIMMMYSGIGIVFSVFIPFLISHFFSPDLAGGYGQPMNWWDVPLYITCLGFVFVGAGVCGIVFLVSMIKFWIEMMRH